MSRTLFHVFEGNIPEDDDRVFPPRTRLRHYSSSHISTLKSRQYVPTLSPPLSHHRSIQPGDIIVSTGMLNTGVSSRTLGNRSTEGSTDPAKKRGREEEELVCDNCGQKIPGYRGGVLECHQCVWSLTESCDTGIIEQLNCNIGQCMSGHWDREEVHVRHHQNCLNLGTVRNPEKRLRSRNP